LTMKSLCRILKGADLLPKVAELSGWLARGLGDNWSQVRFAASEATRGFLENTTEESRAESFPLLLPRMCLNRYYVAEGVRLYSQKTWKLIMGDTGRSWVAKCAPEVVAYYVEASQANNHAVREAACACIAELMSKIERTAVLPHAATLLTALLDCFKDESWPVRDAACAACGRCVLAFPEEAKEIMEKELYELFFAHTWDNIWSVRQTTAIALGQVVQAYGDEALEKICKMIKDRIAMALIQPKDSRRFSNLSKTSKFGVAGPRPPPDHTLEECKFENQPMFSCGSLAPKLKRGGGCMDHGFTRAKEPWEASDGCIYVIAELASINAEAIKPYLPQLHELARLDQTSFRHAPVLLETLFKKLPAIAKGMGKKAFKPYIEEFLEPLFRADKDSHQLAAAAAGNCIAEFELLLGEGIFNGRLNDSQREQMRTSPNIIRKVGPGAMGGPGGPMGGPGGPWPGRDEGLAMLVGESRFPGA